VELCIKKEEKKKSKLQNNVIRRTTPKPIFINLFKLKVATASIDYDSATLIFLYYEQIPGSKESEPTNSTHIM